MKKIRKKSLIPIDKFSILPIDEEASGTFNLDEVDHFLVDLGANLTSMKTKERTEILVFYFIPWDQTENRLLSH